MVVVSKPLFYERCGNHIKCDAGHFWSKSCVKANIFLSTNAFLGTLKFFLPIYIIKAIINHKKLKDKQFLWSLLKEEIRSGVYGFAMAHLLLMTICLLSKLNGRINYYSLGFLPGVVSGLALIVETKENRTLDSLIFFNLVIEAVFKNMAFFNILKLTRAKETVIFMIVSGLLMHTLQNRKKNVRLTNFWFYTPHRFKEDNLEFTESKIEPKCGHNESCVAFSFKGAQKYFVLGYAFSIVRKLIPKMLVVFKQPQKLFKICINKDNVRFGMFIGAYVGLYRYIVCFLLKSKSIDQKYFGVIAGCLSGATYSISPSLQVLTVGITTLCQTFYHNILKSVGVKNQLIPEVLVYMLSHGVLFHNVIMCQQTCPSYYTNMLYKCSNNIFKDMYREIVFKYLDVVV